MHKAGNLCILDSLNSVVEQPILIATSLKNSYGMGRYTIYVVSNELPYSCL